MTLALELDKFIRNPGFQVLADYCGWLAGLKSKRLFRGQSGHWSLTPSVYRSGKVGIRNQEQLDQWAAFAGPLVLGMRPQTPLEWLVLAQHHSIATSLLDWTTSPLIALFFACQGSSEADGEVFALRERDYPVAHHTLMVSVFDEEAKDSMLLVPARAFHPRAAIQHSVMTLARREGDLSPGTKTLRVYSVSGGHKQVALEALKVLGIDDVALMADIQTAANVFVRQLESS